jgi:hypothetical protein
MLGILFCYGILLLTLDLKNYCEHAHQNNKYYSEIAITSKTEADYKEICDEVRKEYVRNQIYEKFLNTFYKNFEAKSLEEAEIVQYVKNNSFGHLKLSASILKLTKCCLYCLGLFVAIMILPNIFFYIMKAFLKKILVYIFVIFIFEALCNFYMNLSVDIMKAMRFVDYFDLRSRFVEGVFSYYWETVKNYIF